MATNIELSNIEINEMIYLNILKMLKRRNLINDVKEIYSIILPDINNKVSIEFNLIDNTKCSVYIISAKLSSILRNTPVDDYLSNNIDIHKIVILKDAVKKVIRQILIDYRNTEFFFEHEMLEDIPSKIFIPRHEILDKADKCELLTKFSIGELSVILDTDTMARYYNAHVGDIFRIYRPSLICGTSIYYRIVSSGSLDNLYI